MSKQLTVFDLDHTLLPIDTGDLWVRYLLRESERDPRPVVQTIERFTREYRAGVLDIREFVNFQMRFLASFPRSFLDAALKDYIERIIRPCMTAEGRWLVEREMATGAQCVICTATYRFVAQAVAQCFGIDQVLATTPKQDVNGRFLGVNEGIVTYRAGKVDALREWLSREANLGREYDRLRFYSDSAADLPMFEYVAAHGGVNTVVNPEPGLLAFATAQNWRRLSTFTNQDLEHARQLAQCLANATQF